MLQSRRRAIAPDPVSVHQPKIVLVHTLNILYRTLQRPKTKHIGCTISLKKARPSTDSKSIEELEHDAAATTEKSEERMQKIAMLRRID